MTLSKSAYSHFVPGVVKVWRGHNRMVELLNKLESEHILSPSGKERVTNASKTIRNKRLVNCFARIVLAEAAYEAAARTYAYGARDWNLKMDQTAQASDTSLTAGALAAAISTMIPNSYADSLRWMEIGASGARAAFEQWYFRKIGLVIDPAAVLLNPVNQFALETAAKLASVQPVDDELKKYVYTLGIVGNVIRVAVNDLLLAGLVGKYLCDIDYRMMALKDSARYLEARGQMSEILNEMQCTSHKIERTIYTEAHAAIKDYILFEDY